MGRRWVPAARRVRSLCPVSLPYSFYSLYSSCFSGLSTATVAAAGQKRLQVLSALVSPEDAVGNALPSLAAKVTVHWFSFLVKLNQWIVTATEGYRGRVG